MADCGAGESFSFHYLSRAAASLAEEHPDIRFHITSGDTQDLMDELTDGLIDFAVIFTEVDHDLYQSITLPESDRFGVLMPKAHPLASKETVRIRDLKGYPVILSRAHAAVISGMKDFSECIEQVKRFLPFVDNWATCDQLSPKVFKKHRAELLGCVREWIRSDLTYTLRFGIGTLMQHFLDDDFDPLYPELVAKLRSEEYYVNMMIAWYFATALAKQYESILPFIEEKRLDDWTHNKAIQKSLESRRITEEQKLYLKSLKVVR